MEKKEVQISLHGCDDSTHIRIMATRNEIDFLINLSEMSKKASQYGCMPTMRIEEDAKSFNE